jgi:hypothetical protein
MAKESLRILVTITHGEDQKLFDYLSSCEGRDRNRRTRMLIRNGFALLQGANVSVNPSQLDDVRTSTSSTVQDIPASTPRLSNSTFDAYDSLDLNPADFEFGVLSPA